MLEAKYKVLTLKDAIMLALRNNPAIRSSELQRIIDKYQVILAKQTFRPKYNLSFNDTVNQQTFPTYGLRSGVELLTPIGSRIGVNYLNNATGGGGAGSFTWVQPLLRDFGRVNQISVEDAFSNDRIAKLAFKNNIIVAVVNVIAAYRQLVQNYNNLRIQKRILKESADALQQYKLKVRVGKMAPSDLLQQKANYETTKLAVVRQENALQQNYQRLLSTIGLMPTANLLIVKKIAMKRFRLPTEAQAIQKALQGNIAYQQALLRLENTKRAIISAKNERKWKLNVKASAQIGEDNPAPTGLLLTPIPNEGSQVQFDAEIPIDNVKGKADEVDAEVQLEQAKLTLQQEKQDLIRQVMTQLQTIRSDWQQIQVSRSAVSLQAATLKAARLKLNYGRATVFEVTRDQDSLLQQETSLVATEIAYLNDITALENTWGTTLDVWNIQLGY